MVNAGAELRFQRGLNLLGVVYPLPSFPRRRESTFCFRKLDPRLRGDDGLVVIQLSFIVL
jgi:hypothetical protein